MILIITHHYSVHGNFDFENNLSFNRLFIHILSLGGKLGVNCFVLISGYFCCQKQGFRWKSIISFVLKVTIFSLVINCFTAILGYNTFSIKFIIQSVFPLIYKEWWFASTYFILVLLSPFINDYINKISKEKHKNLILLLFILWCIIPTLTNFNMESNELLWFIFLYICSSYISIYKDDFNLNRRKTISIFSLSTTFIIISAIIFDIINNSSPFFNKSPTYYAGMQELPLFIQSITLFIIFKNLNIKKSKIINGLSSLMFGVYLIHDSAFFRKFFWINFFKNSKYQNSSYLVFHSLVSIVYVFLFCSIISYLYNITLGKKINDFLYNNKFKEKA